MDFFNRSYIAMHRTSNMGVVYPLIEDEDTEYIFNSESVHLFEERIRFFESKVEQSEFYTHYFAHIFIVIAAAGIRIWWTVPIALLLGYLLGAFLKTRPGFIMVSNKFIPMPLYNAIQRFFVVDIALFFVYIFFLKAWWLIPIHISEFFLLQNSVSVLIRKKQAVALREVAKRIKNGYSSSRHSIKKIVAIVLVLVILAGAMIVCVVNPRMTPMIKTPHAELFSAVGYNYLSKTLVVQFRNSGAKYAFYNVPLREWNSFYDSNFSKSYYADTIRGDHRYELLTTANPLMILTSGGKKTITVEVIGNKGISFEHVLKTECSTLAGALIEADLVKGDYSEHGLYITSVDGLVADYSVDGSYWSLSKNGEMLMTDASSTKISDGDHYELTYEISYKATGTNSFAEKYKAFVNESKEETSSFKENYKAVVNGSKEETSQFKEKYKAFVNKSKEETNSFAEKYKAFVNGSNNE